MDNNLKIVKFLLLYERSSMKRDVISYYKNDLIANKHNIMNLYQYKYNKPTNNIIIADEDDLYYIKLYLEMYGLALEFVPDEFKSPYICLTAVKSDGLSLEFVPKESKTPFICLAAIKSDGLSLKFVPEELKNENEELCLAAITSNGLSLEFVPEKLKNENEELCLAAVTSNGLSLEFVPEKLKNENEELCLAAVTSDGLSLEFVPEKFKDEKLCLTAINLNGLSLEFVPEEFKDEKLYLAAVKSNKLSFTLIPKQNQQISLLEESLKVVSEIKYKVINDIINYPNKYLNEIIVHIFNIEKYYDVLKNIEQSDNSDIIIQNILETSHNKFNFINKKLLTQDICMNAIINKYTSLNNIPIDFRIYKLCNEAIKIDGKSLQYVPIDLIDMDLCESAINQDGISLKYIPKELITLQLCIDATLKTNKAIQYIPKNIVIEYPHEYYMICRRVLEENSELIQYIFTEYESNPEYESKYIELFYIVLKHDGKLLQWIPIKNRSLEICTYAIDQDAYALSYVPDTIITEELCYRAIETNTNPKYDILQYVPDTLKTYEICFNAVNKNVLSISHVPKSIMTQELCDMAIEKNTDNRYDIIKFILKNIPAKFKTIELFHNAVKQNWMILRELGIEHQTPEIIKEAILQNNNAVNHILSDYDINNCDSNEYNEKYLVTLNKIEKILNLFSKEECFNDLNHPKIIEIDENTNYYSSLNMIHDSNYLDYFKNKYYCWSTDIIEQSLLHLFNGYRKPLNIVMRSPITEMIIQPIICRFKLKKYRIIDSDNSCNDNIFQGILNDNVIELIEIVLSKACEKTMELSKVYELKLFQRENNKYILYILELINKKLDPSEYIYGYYNRHDQNELALMNFNNIINLDTLLYSNILSITHNINTDTNKICTFPINEDMYRKLCKLLLVAYINDKYNTTEDKLKNCTLKYKMIFYKRSTIVYQDFDNHDITISYNKYIEINPSTPEYIDYFKKKYLKYKNKYLKLQNKNY
jgi:hypothetical protein